jgi:CRP-like cAMP-binding protein
MSKHILIIEDDEILKENITELLSLSGYKVSATTNGKKGIKMAQELNPDLIICDIMMPETDGYSVLYALNQNDITAVIPFIFITAKTQNTALRKGMELGADDFIYKPFEDIELLNAIEGRLTKMEQINQKNDQKINSGFEPHITHAEVLSTLLEKADILTIQKGEVLYRESDYPHFVFYLRKGSIKTYQLSSQGKNFITELYKEGQLIGYKPIIENRTYNQYAEANEDCQLLKITSDQFTEALFNNEKMAAHFIRHLSKKLSQKEEELMSVAYNSVRYRVGYKLYQLSSDNQSNEIYISRSDLAELVGTTAETIARTLSDFKQENLIEIEEHTIYVPHPDKLRAAIKLS